MLPAGPLAVDPLAHVGVEVRVGPVDRAAAGVLVDERQDLVLLDGELPGSPIKDLIDELHSLNPAPKIIVMSSDLELGRLYLRDGADAFSSKSDQPDWLLTSLRRLSGPVKE